MINYSTIPISLWGEAIKIVMHIFNRILTKEVQKTTHELWIDRKLSLGYMHI